MGGRHASQNTAGAQLSPIPLPPHPVTGWFCSTYVKHWGFQIALTIASKAQERLLMGIPLAQAVNPFENVMIDFSRGMSNPGDVN